MRNLFWMLLLLGGLAVPSFYANEQCTARTKEYKTTSFTQDDFLLVDDSILIDDSLRLNTEQELNTEQLVLGLDQPLYVDYLAEGAGANQALGFFFFDIDTDKDGVPDFMETGPTDDLDGDGILNEDDSDDDNDGILDGSDKVPAGVTSMPASYFRFGTTAAANSNTVGDYWQFVPNSKIASGTYAGKYEHPGVYLYIDNNNNKIPDILEYTVGSNKHPPMVVDKGYNGYQIAAGATSAGTFPGLLGNWEYSGTPGDTVEDRYHWTGSTIFFLCDDDGDTGMPNDYKNYNPYGTTKYSDKYTTTDANIDYDIYGTTDPKSSLVPSKLKNLNSLSTSADDTFKTDARGVQQYKYRWYKSDVSGSRELVFFLIVYYNNGGSIVNTYYSKSGFNLDTPPASPTVNSPGTNGDAYGTWASKTNWFPGYRSTGDHNLLANGVYGTNWSTFATAPTDGTSPVAKAGFESRQDWIDEWENWRQDRRVIQYRALKDWFSGTAVNANTIINGRYGLDMTLENDSSLIRSINNKMAHLMVGAPATTRDAWLLGWEDLFNGGDRDFEDVVFYVKREGGGKIQSNNAAQELQEEFEDFSLSQVSFTFVDNFKDTSWNVEGRYINYYYKLSSADPWIPLLGGQHLRTPDLFQPANGGKTETSGSSVTRTVTIEINNKKQEIYWKTEMATENVDTFTPEVSEAVVNYQTLVHDFYYNSAQIPSSNMLYIASHETPDGSWLERNRNRGHLYALKTFEHGDPIELVSASGIDPEKTPTSQPAEPFQWDAGVSMKDQIDNRTFYTYLQNDNSTTHSQNLYLTEIPKTSISNTDLVDALQLSDDKKDNIWVDNYHAPDADERDTTSASLWLFNWLRGYLNPTVVDGVLVSAGPEREWILGGINRPSPYVIRSPGIPRWLLGKSVDLQHKLDYLNFVDSDDQKELPSRIIIGTEWGTVHAIDAGVWTSSKKNEDDVWADGSYKDDNFGTGNEVWGLLPGHLLDDVKYNYTGASSVIAKVESTATGTIIRKPSGSGTSAWQRVAVFTQGFKGGAHTPDDEARTGNYVWALDLTDPDEPIPMWQRSDLNSSDIVNPVAIAWAEIGSTPTWVVAYSTGATEISDMPPAFIVVNASTGEKIDSVSLNVGTNGHTMMGSPALIDSDSNGYVDLMVGGTSEGLLVAVDLKTGSMKTTSVSGRIFLTPNLRLNGDETLTVIAITGDSPYVYDHDLYSSEDFINTVQTFVYDVAGGSWTGPTNTFNLGKGHKAFSRPILVGSKLVMGTTTGDTPNICDYDPTDPGNLYLFNIDDISETDVVDNIGSIIAPIMYYGGNLMVHQNTHAQSGEGNANTDPFRGLSSEPKIESFKDTNASSFGIVGSPTNVLQNVSVKKEE